MSKKENDELAMLNTPFASEIFLKNIRNKFCSSGRINPRSIGSFCHSELLPPRGKS